MADLPRSAGWLKASCRLSGHRSLAGLVVFLQAFSSTGPLVRMVFQIIVDMRYFMLILLVVVLAFASSFYALLHHARPLHSGDDDDDDNVLHVQDAVAGRLRHESVSVGRLRGAAAGAVR
jgi:cell division protein FtsL